MNATSDARLIVDLQLATQHPEHLPSKTQFLHWAQEAYMAASLDDARLKKQAEITLRIVDVEEMQMLNETYRGKSGPTNVLSFAVDDEISDATQGFLAIEDAPPLLGDVVICVAVVNQEAAEQNKPIGHHFAHMVTHGVLHLCGYDHQNDAQAACMESLETTILMSQGIPDPYSTL